MTTTWILGTDRPIYAQLIEQIELRIVSGIYRAGDKLPSVRDMAGEAAVNPNTMQKALAELERSGLVYSQRTTGRFITDDKELIQKMKDKLASEQIAAFLEKMRELGFTREETLSLMEKVAAENEEKGDVLYGADSGM